MKDIIVFLVVLCLFVLFLRKHPLILIIIAITIISALIINIVKKERKKRKEAVEIWRKEQEQKEKEHQKYIEEQERQQRIRNRKKEEEQELKKRQREQERRQEEILRKKYDVFNQKLDSLKQYEIELSDEKHNRNDSIYIEPKNITKSTSFVKIKDFIAVDTETTGLKAAGNDIIQLSAVKFINFEPVEIFSTYIKPRKHIPEEATEINGITDEMVQSAPNFCQIVNSFNEFIGDLPLVAHNAPFDTKHLYANGLDSIENKTIFDTLKLSQKVFPESYSHKLKDICEECDIYFSDAHNSDYDSLAAGMLFVELVANIKDTTSRDLIELVG